MKNNMPKITYGLAIFIFVTTMVLGGMMHRFAVISQSLVSPVYAEDEGEEKYEGEEDEDEEDEDENKDQSPQTSTSKIKSVPIYKTVLVTKIITILDPIFTTDQDGDNLVDGLDPHPTMHEREYFTDDDDDGVSNAFDRYRDEDDFDYYEQENDENGDGILDSYEFMGER
jgi:hypothetical protein